MSNTLTQQTETTCPDAWLYEQEARQNLLNAFQDLASSSNFEEDHTDQIETLTKSFGDWRQAITQISPSNGFTREYIINIRAIASQLANALSTLVFNQESFNISNGEMNPTLNTDLIKVNRLLCLLGLNCDPDKEQAFALDAVNFDLLVNIIEESVEWINKGIPNHIRLTFTRSTTNPHYTNVLTAKLNAKKIGGVIEQLVSISQSLNQAPISINIEVIGLKAFILVRLNNIAISQSQLDEDTNFQDEMGKLTRLANICAIPQVSTKFISYATLRDSKPNTEVNITLTIPLAISLSEIEA